MMEVGSKTVTCVKWMKLVSNITQNSRAVQLSKIYLSNINILPIWGRIWEQLHYSYMEQLNESK